MPELFRFYGFLFFFYTREHEPIHVEGAEGMAIFDYDEESDSFIIREKKNIKSNDLKRIKGVIADNKDIIIKRWKETFE